MYLAICIDPTNELYNINVAINRAIKNMEGLLESMVWILPIIIRIDDKTQINVSGEYANNRLASLVLIYSGPNRCVSEEMLLMRIRDNPECGTKYPV